MSPTSYQAAPPRVIDTTPLAALPQLPPLQAPTERPNPFTGSYIRKLQFSYWIFVQKATLIMQLCKNLGRSVRRSVVLLPARSSKCSPCYLAGQLAIFEFQLTIYENIFDALGKLRRLRISGRIFNGEWIEDGYICEIAFLEQATIEQTLALRRERRHFAYALFQRKQMLVANVASQESRHGAERARVCVLFVERPIERHLAGVQAETGPRLL